MSAPVQAPADCRHRRKPIRANPGGDGGRRLGSSLLAPGYPVYGKLGGRAPLA
jgi:hypothetical protein